VDVMSGYVMAAAGYWSGIAVLEGPRLLSGVSQGPGLEEHRVTWEVPAVVTAGSLIADLRKVRLLGRGGAHFPFVRKLTTALEAGRKREVVVNAAESEPASAKDSALMTTAPHLVLDGADLVARVLKARTVRVVVPADRPAVVEAVRAAVAEREAARSAVRHQVYVSDGGFVGGQRQALMELIEGRENLPVTAWQPEAESGVFGRPTLLANAETFAQVAALCALGVGTYARAGTSGEPGTTLLTVAGDGPGGVVIEVPLGEPLAVVMHRCGYDPEMPALVGGYHGTWLPAHEVARRRLSNEDLSNVGGTLGCGVVLPLAPTACPVSLTAQIVEYLAGSNARRCGPCTNGLPALAASLTALATGGGMTASTRIASLTELVSDRGACTHPDGTVRLVRSLMTAFPAEVAEHERGGCGVA
jgi:NADH:ubiquinone oxidoreductase subunit F (NADH-binding)